MSATGGAQDLALDHAELSAWLGDRGARSATVLVDAAVAATDTTDRVVRAVRAAAHRMTSVVLPGGWNLARVEALARDIDGSDVVVGVGGGSLLDQAKLAAAATDGQLPALVRGRGRCGFLPLDDSLRRAPLLVAVPTTLGTGSERSGNAVLDVPEGRLLVGGAVLRPDLALLHPGATRGLPSTLVLQGVFEALSRTMGPYAGAEVELGRQDQLTVAVTRRLATLGHQLAGLGEPGSAAGDPQRLEVARIGGLSHTGAMHEGRNPFAYKAWYLANELSWLAGTTKNAALAALLPPLWAHLLAGRTAWGSPARLRHVWGAVAATDPARLSFAPDVGLRQLLARWGLSGWAPRGVDVDALTERVVHRWGAGLPFLGGVDVADLRGVLADALTPGATGADPLAATGSRLELGAPAAAGAPLGAEPGAAGDRR